MSILSQIGNTPLVEAVNLVTKPGVKLFLKLEGNNPGGSVKDRPAFNMISEAVKRGDIKKGDRLVEATSGNTGIALAYIANVWVKDVACNARKLHRRARKNNACLWC